MPEWKYGWVVETGTLLTCWSNRIRRFESSCKREPFKLAWKWPNAADDMQSFYFRFLMELRQTWCMRRTENPENVVRIHKAPLLLGCSPAATRADCKSAVIRLHRLASLYSVATRHSSNKFDSALAAPSVRVLSPQQLYGVGSSVGRVLVCGSSGHGFDPRLTPFRFNSSVGRAAHL